MKNTCFLHAKWVMRFYAQCQGNFSRCLWQEYTSQRNETKEWIKEWMNEWSLAITFPSNQSWIVKYVNHLSCCFLFILPAFWKSAVNFSKTVHQYSVIQTEQLRSSLSFPSSQTLISHIFRIHKHLLPKSSQKFHLLFIIIFFQLSLVEIWKGHVIQPFR